MSQREVGDAIRRVLPIIKSGKGYSEDETRKKIIDPILRALGWRPRYGSGSQDRYCITEYYPFKDSSLRADYAMFDPSRREVIIVEAKKLLDEDTRDHYVQLARYMVGGRDLVGVLTNGKFWNICRLDRRGRPSEEKPIMLASRPVSESAGRLFTALDKGKWH